MTVGLPWVNMSAYGIDAGFLIVGIEVPLRQAGKAANRTSINYSGPTAGVLQRAWDAAEALAIE
jgi:hypothetical protein